MGKENVNSNPRVKGTKKSVGFASSSKVAEYGINNSPVESIYTTSVQPVYNQKATISVTEEEREHFDTLSESDKNQEEKALMRRAIQQRLIEPIKANAACEMLEDIDTIIDVNDIVCVPRGTTGYVDEISPDKINVLEVIGRKYSNFILFAGLDFQIGNNSLTEEEDKAKKEMFKKRYIDRKIHPIEFLHTMEAYYVEEQKDNKGIWGDVIKIPGETKDTFIYMCIYRRPGNLPSFGLKERGSLTKLPIIPQITPFPRIPPNSLRSRQSSNKKKFEPVTPRIGGRTKKRRSNRRATCKKRRT